MAAVNWEKIKTRDNVRGLVRHCMIDTRMKTNHNNKEIDVNKTGFNPYFKFSSTYDDVMKSYDERIKYIDENSPLKRKPRKDRVTLISLNAPVPEGIENKKDQLRFFEKVLSETQNFFGSENVVGAAIHYDEVHEYIDSETKQKRVSRPHMHMFVVPCTDDGRLSARDVFTRKNLIEYNKMIDEKCFVSFGVQFNTGTKKRSYKTVEELKKESAYHQLRIEAYQSIKQSAYDDGYYDGTAKAEEQHEVLLENTKRRCNDMLEQARKDCLNERNDMLQQARRDCLKEREDAMRECNRNIQNAYDEAQKRLKSEKEAMLEEIYRNIKFASKSRLEKMQINPRYVGSARLNSYVASLEDDDQSLEEIKNSISSFLK